MSDGPIGVNSERCLQPASGQHMLQTHLEISVPAAIAWRLLTDTQAWPHWGPSVRAVEAPMRHIGPGLRGRVQTTLGFWLPFEITHWQPSSQRARQGVGVPATRHIVTSIGPARCRVTFTIPSWAPFYVPVCRVALPRLGDLAVATAS